MNKDQTKNPFSHHQVVHPMTYTMRKATNILSYFLLSSKTLNDSLKNAQNLTETLKIDTKTSQPKKQNISQNQEPNMFLVITVVLLLALALLGYTFYERSIDTSRNANFLCSLESHSIHAVENPSSYTSNRWSSGIGTLFLRAPA